MRRKLNYFDLGLGPHPHELEFMVKKVLPKFGDIDFNAYGIEAHPKFLENAKKIFENYENIHLYNLAISNKTGKEKLYLQKNNKDGNLGNSIFETKNNIDKNKFYEVECCKFSTFLNQNKIVLSDSINILKVNIEGAELYLWEDFKENNLRNNFQILCGHKDHDIIKVSELEKKHEEYFKLLKELDINLMHFCHYDDHNSSVKNMIKKLTDILNETQ